MKARELELLDKIIGDWAVDLTAKMPDGATLQGKGIVKARGLSMDRGVYTEMRADIPGMGQYHEDDLWGFDQWEKKMHLYSITSTGAVHDHSGRWKDERTLEFHWEGLYEGKPATEDTTLTWVSDKEIHVHEVDTSEGQVGPVFDYIVKKQ